MRPMVTTRCYSCLLIKGTQGAKVKTGGGNGYGTAVRGDARRCSESRQSVSTSVRPSVSSRIGLHSQRKREGNKFKQERMTCPPLTLRPFGEPSIPPNHKEDPSVLSVSLAKGVSPSVE